MALELVVVEGKEDKIIKMRSIRFMNGGIKKINTSIVSCTARILFTTYIRVVIGIF